LKTLAVARMYLDNIPNMQSSWVTQGDKVGQMALLYGANDMGSTMMEENVVSQAGATFRMTEQTIRRVIADLGLAPRRRNMYYDILPEPESEVRACGSASSESD
jgi:cyclic dehypoxanthinyl futalosine synthase